MKIKDLEMICFITYGLGTLLLALAVLVWASHGDIHWYIYPDEINAAITPIVVLSIVFLVVGMIYVLFLWRAKRETTTQESA